MSDNEALKGQKLEKAGGSALQIALQQCAVARIPVLQWHHLTLASCAALRNEVEGCSALQFTQETVELTMMPLFLQRRKDVTMTILSV